MFLLSVSTQCARSRFGRGVDRRASDEAETMRQWEHAAPELARVEHMPLLWNRLGDPVDE